MPYREADFDHEDSNRSGNPHFGEILATRLDRRRLLKGGLGLAVTAGLFGSAAMAADGAASMLEGRRGPRPGRALGFTPVQVGRANAVVVPPEYEFRIILPWGEPITGAYPAYRDGGLNTGTKGIRRSFM